ncbi:hypothetical protein ACFYYP_32405 [Microbispora rosea]|uniref:hypothetical protein n=1 Tax=Microbispora rosea TaxID=58117 RepID=UPI003695429D
MPFVEGSPSWTYGSVALSCANGLHFQPAQLPGWYSLLVTPGAPVTLDFTFPAWLVRVVSADGTSDLTVTGFSGGLERTRQRFDSPDQTVTWRNRGLQRVVLEGTGSVSFVGYHLLDGKASWEHLTHLCLPIADPAYPCSSPLGQTEEQIAAARLPKPVASEWPTRFAPQFGDLAAALHRLVRHQSPPVLPAPSDPDEPALLAGEREMLALALLDPHVARILGTAYDDPLPGGLDGREYVYQVIGTWRGNRLTYDAADGDVLTRASADGVLSQGPGTELTFTPPVLDLAVTWLGVAGATWAAEDPDGAVSTGSVKASGEIRTGVTARLTLTGPGLPGIVQRLMVTPRILRSGLLPGIVAVEPGPPAGPSDIRVTVFRRSPTTPVLAALDWDTPRAPDGTVPDGAPVAYQVGERHLGPDPAAPAPAPPAGTLRSDLVGDGAAIYLAEQAAEMYLAGRRRTLTPGWWGWWSRGVDLFGRVSAPSAWGVAAVLDDATPPRPILTDAEYVQPAAPAVATGHSAEALRWLTGHPTDEGLVCRWSYGPNQAARTDVGRFRVAVRFPAPGVTGPGAYQEFPGGPPGGKPGNSRVVAELGPVITPVSAPVTGVTADPVLPVEVISVTPLPPNPLEPVTSAVTSLCRVDLSTDGADGVFADAVLRVAGTDHPVVSSSPGAQLLLSIEHLAGTTVPTGPGELRPAAGRLVRVEAALPSAGTTGLRPGAGVAAWGSERLAVLACDDHGLLCLASAEQPEVGAWLSWYPDWFAQLPGAGVGLAPGEAEPARAQIAVRAVRPNGRESPPSSPAAITAVDVTVPDPPTVNAVPFDPADRCAALASAATPFSGRSRFTLRWTAVPGRTVTVWRALSDEICQLDLAEHDRDGRPHAFLVDHWLPGVYAEPLRRQRVETELAAVDEARKLTGAERGEAVRAAYDALTIDTQMLLARQEYAADAFAPLTAEPLAGAAFEDEFDGRGHAHWLYRLTTRTGAGIESLPTEPTPPICSPDVVPPAVPLALMALADPAGGAVVVHWQAAPDADLHHYDLYATRDRPVAADLANTAPTLVVTPKPHVPAVILTARLEVEPGDWWLAVRAVDTSDNRSAFSEPLPGRSLRPRPVAPVWISAERDGAVVRLRWRHDTDARLACLVERRPPGGDLLGWQAVSAWLPRGEYEYTDEPADLDSAYEYRLRVRDHLGQTCTHTPVIPLPADDGSPA